MTKFKSNGLRKFFETLKRPAFESWPLSNFLIFDNSLFEPETCGLEFSCFLRFTSFFQVNSARKKIRGTSRRGGWSEDGSRPATPVHHYNLRRRTANPRDNPVLDAESPNSFGKLVSHLSHITQVRILLN